MTTRQWTPEEQERIDRRRSDPAWELATEEEMATTSEAEEANLKCETAEDHAATRVTLDISVDPVDMAVGDDTLDESAVLSAIREVATETWPDAVIKFKTLQIGHSQGDGWAKCWIDGVRNDPAADALLQSIDWTDEELYE